MRILVFLHGTAIMHPTAVGRSRSERVAQSRQGGQEVLDFAGYVPTEAAVDKVLTWQGHGAQICYLSSHTPDGGEFPGLLNPWPPGAVARSWPSR